jgi:SAM-dependent methyltransferase
MGAVMGDKEAAAATEDKERREFWNRRARTFPRYSPAEDCYEARMLDLAVRHGARFEGARILDVGCGTGMYAIRLAKVAARVTALDSSDAMLDILRRDAEAHGANNIDIVNSSWLDFDPGKGHDTLFCSMTPALGDEAGKEKAAACRGAAVVFIGWNGLRRSDVMEGLVARLKTTPEASPKAFNNAPEMRRWLEGRGIRYEALPVEGSWRVGHAKEDLLERSLDGLSAMGVEADPAEISELLEAHRLDDGSYLEVTDYKVEMVVWRN